MKVFKKLLTTVLLSFLIGLAACGTDGGKEKAESKKPEGAPDTWIADRKLTGLIFMSDQDTELNPEIMEEIKKRTGIELELQTVSANSSLEGLTAGLAAGDLPDFIGNYLNNSGRPEMPVILKAAREGQFTDLTPYLKESKVFSKYFEEGFLPTDTEKNVMFRDEFDGASYFVHMEIPRHPGTVKKKYVGGVHVLKDVVDQLGIDPSKITTSEQVHQLLKDIKELELKDSNGRTITPLGPTVWGGAERRYIYNDLTWTGESGEGFLEDDNGKILHESQTDYPEKRVEYVRSLLDEKLMHSEFYTMEENRASEGIINKSFGVISDIHNYMPQNNDLKYVPLGPLDTAKGTYQMELSYKTGYNSWSIPATTENPEDIVKFADFLSSREGKLLTHYGLEGRDYDLDEDGNPVVKEEVKQLLKEKPEEAKKLGFRGVGNYWADILGSTDVDHMEDFGEEDWGTRGDDSSVSQQLLDLYGYEEKAKNAVIVDGLSVKTFIDEFDKEGKLKIAFDTYDANMLRAYYVKTEDESEKILQESRDLLNAAGLKEFIKFVEEKAAAEDLQVRF